MMPFIQQALVMGYTAGQVLKHISKAFKGSQSGINNARKQGYDDEDILKYLSGKAQPKNKKNAERQVSDQDAYLKSVGIKTKEERAETRDKFIGGALGTAVTAVTAYNAYNNYSGALSGIGEMLGIGGEPEPGPEVMGDAPVQPDAIETPIPDAAVAVPTPEITQETIDTTPELQPEYDFLQQQGLIPKIQTMVKAGKPKEAIVAFLKKKMPMMEAEQLRFMGGEPGQPKMSLDKKLNDVVDKFFPEAASLVSKAPEEAPLQQGDQVLTMSGDLGNVEAMSGDNVLIGDEGKIKNLKEDQIITPPLPAKDLADLYEDLIGGIEKETGQDVSRNVFWSGYDAKNNELAYIPHNGALYTYRDIETDIVEELTSLLTKRKTTGENYIGAWAEGTKSPIGAAMSKIIQRLQKERGGKGSEYAGKFESVYDALEPAKKAKKAKYAKKKKAKKSESR